MRRIYTFRPYVRNSLPFQTAKTQLSHHRVLEEEEQNDRRDTRYETRSHVDGLIRHIDGSLFESVDTKAERRYFFRVVKHTS
jgi:hypothetical protein